MNFPSSRPMMRQKIGCFLLVLMIVLAATGVKSSSSVPRLRRNLQQDQKTTFQQTGFFVGDRVDGSFGSTMAMDGDTLVVGQPNDVSDVYTDIDEENLPLGKVYVYRKDSNSGNWALDHTILPAFDNPASGKDSNETLARPVERVSEFGTSVALRGNLVAIQAYVWMEGTQDPTSRFFIYERAMDQDDEEDWTLQYMMNVNDINVDDGRDLQFVNDTALALRHDQWGIGLFTRETSSSNQWHFTGTLMEKPWLEGFQFRGNAEVMLNVGQVLTYEVSPDDLGLKEERLLAGCGIGAGCQQSLGKAITTSYTWITEDMAAVGKARSLPIEGDPNNRWVAIEERRPGFWEETQQLQLPYVANFGPLLDTAETVDTLYLLVGGKGSAHLFSKQKATDSKWELHSSVDLGNDNLELSSVLLGENATDIVLSAQNFNIIRDSSSSGEAVELRATIPFWSMDGAVFVFQPQKETQKRYGNEHSGGKYIWGTR